MNATAIRTHGEAVKVVETITAEDFTSLLRDSHGAVTILEPRRPQRHATQVRQCSAPHHVLYEYCGSRSGYTETGMVSIHRAIFNFYNLDRIVTVAR